MHLENGEEVFVARSRAGEKRGRFLSDDHEQQFWRRRWSGADWGRP